MNAVLKYTKYRYMANAVIVLRVSQLGRILGLAVFASLSVTSLTGQEARLLTTAAEVRALSEVEARQAVPVRLNGVLTGMADPDGIAFVLQDETAGIYVQAPAEHVAEVSLGDLIEIEGVSDPGGFAPFVVAHSLRRFGKGELPDPLKVRIDELNTGQMDAKWVEFSGIVRSVEPLVPSDLSPPPPGTRYESTSTAAERLEATEVKLKVTSGLSSVMVGVDGLLDPAELVDAKVTIRGVCYNLHNRNRQFVKPFVQVTDLNEVVIENPPPSDPFAAQIQAVASLLQFDNLGDKPGHRVHVRGVVVHHRPGYSFWVRDEGHSLRVESSQSDLLRPGDVVDVLGFTALGEYSPILEDAIFRKIREQSLPQPVPLKTISDALVNDANLVQLEAKLAELRRFSDRVELSLDWEGTTVLSRMFLQDEVPDVSDWLPGSVVKVSGVCSVLSDGPGPLGGLWVPSTFSLMLRSPEDLLVVHAPPWWNAERIAWLLLGFLLLAMAAIATISFVSKRRLQEQNQRRAMAETEFSAILKERNRLAREIHDTLSQSLGAISVQLELARAHAGELSDAAKSNLGTAHKLARGALAEARDSIWNMRSQVLEKYDLGGALGRITEQLTDGTGVRSEIQVKGERRRLSPMVENNLLRIGQEAIVNACKHANPKTITVSLTFERRRVWLLVEDDGAGFDLGTSQKAGRRSFGLVGMQERADLLGGEVAIESAPGKGTRISVTITT